MNIWLHRWAVLTCCVVFLLVLSGGTVTSLKVGMADAVWPTPPWYLLASSRIQDALARGWGFLIEHGHRQIGWIVGVMTIILAGWIWRKDERFWVKTLGVIALAAVSSQGILGGLRVVLNARWGLELASVHGVSAQLIFSLLGAIALVTSPSWKLGPLPAQSAGAGRLRRLGILTTGLIVVQIVAGVILRQFGEGLYLHIFLALAVVTHVVSLAVRVWGSGENRYYGPLLLPIRWMNFLVGLQFAVGLLAWAWGGGAGALDPSPLTFGRAWMATAHMGMSALLLMTCVIFVMRAYRHLEPISDTQLV